VELLLLFLKEGGERKVMEEEILPHLDNFIGQVFDKICVEILRCLVDEEKVKLSYERAGRWWNGKEEIDLVAVRRDEPVFCSGVQMVKEARRNRHPEGGSQKSDPDFAGGAKG
jgi:hypothetical protein